MLVPVFVTGLAASILTEILKLFPSINDSEDKKRITAFIISIIVSIVYIVSEGEPFTYDALAFILGVLAASFTVYKSLIQPLQAIARKS